MFDFCATLPLGFACMFGGFLGYVAKGSVVSLAAGGGSGAGLMALGYFSLQRYQKNEDRRIFAGASLGNYHDNLFNYVTNIVVDF